MSKQALACAEDIEEPGELFQLLARDMDRCSAELSPLYGCEVCACLSSCQRLVDNLPPYDGTLTLKEIRGSWLEFIDLRGRRQLRMPLAFE